MAEFEPRNLTPGDPVASRARAIFNGLAKGKRGRHPGGRRRGEKAMTAELEALRGKGAVEVRDDRPVPARKKEPLREIDLVARELGRWEAPKTEARW